MGGLLHVEEELVNQIIDDVVQDLDNQEIVAETIGYYNIVEMGLEGELFSQDKLPSWIESQMEKHDKLKMEVYLSR